VNFLSPKKLPFIGEQVKKNGGSTACVCFNGRQFFFHSFFDIYDILLVVFRSFFRVGGLGFFLEGGGGGGFFFFGCLLFHKPLSWKLLGISEAQLILQEGWLFYCIAVV